MVVVDLLSTVGFGLGLTAGLGWFMDVVEFGFWFDDDESGLAWFEFGFWLGLNLDFGLMIMNLKLEKELKLGKREICGDPFYL